MIAVCLHLSVAYLEEGRGERQKRRACQKFESVYAVSRARIRDARCDWSSFVAADRNLIGDVNGIRQLPFLFCKQTN